MRGHDDSDDAYLKSCGWVSDGSEWCDPRSGDWGFSTPQAVRVQRARDAEQEAEAWIRFAAGVCAAVPAYTSGTGHAMGRDPAREADVLLIEFRRRRDRGDFGGGK